MMTYQTRTVDELTRAPAATVSTAAFGPCWCRAVPGSDGSFDVFRQRSVTASLGRDALVVSNRIPPTGVAIVRRLSDSLSDPIVIATKACPSAAWYWDASPSGWVELDEILDVDLSVDACLTGQPELLFSALLTVGDGLGRGRRLTALTGMS